MITLKLSSDCIENLCQSCIFDVYLLIWHTHPNIGYWNAGNSNAGKISFLLFKKFFVMFFIKWAVLKNKHVDCKWFM